MFISWTNRAPDTRGVQRHHLSGETREQDHKRLLFHVTWVVFFLFSVSFFFIWQQMINGEKYACYEVLFSTTKICHLLVGWSIVGVHIKRLMIHFSWESSNQSLATSKGGANIWSNPDEISRTFLWRRSRSARALAQLGQLWQEFYVTQTGRKSLGLTTDENTSLPLKKGHFKVGLTIGSRVARLGESAKALSLWLITCVISFYVGAVPLKGN